MQIQPNPAVLSLIEVVEAALAPMALYGAGGELIAANAAARLAAGRLAIRIEDARKLVLAGTPFLTLTPLRDGNTLLTGAEPPALCGSAALPCAMLDGCPLPLIALDVNGIVLHWNPAAERVFGYTRQEIEGQPLPAGQAGTGADRDIDWTRLLQGDRLIGVPLRQRRKDGQLLDVRLSIAPAWEVQGGLKIFLALYEDLTELNEALRRLERSQAHLSHAQQLASMGSWVMDFTDDSLTWSPETHRIHGTDPDLFQPTRAAFRSMVHPEDLPRLVAAMDWARSTGENYSVEHRLIRPDGELIHCRLSAEPVKDRSGNVVRMVGIIQDVTSVVRLQEQLLQAQKLETVGRLAAGVAHDFNNLLTIINGHSELLLMNLPSAATLQDSLRAIHDAGEKAASLTRQLLTIGRKQQSEPRHIDLNQLVAEGALAIRGLIGADIRLEVELADAPLCVKADPGQLHQVLLNLAVNAQEAMPGGGRLTIRCRRLGSRPPYVPSALSAAGDWAEFSFADTGKGMDERARARIFEPFFTTKDQSRHSGLGLSTVYSVLSQHGGAVSVESTPGEGSKFSAALPLDVAAALEETPAAAPVERASGATVVVVEDEAAVRAMVLTILGSFGYEVVEFASPEAAVGHFESGGAADLLITDLIMPGMHGTEVARRARALHPGLPILFMSGYAEPDGEAALARNSITGFLAKPFHPKELTELVAKLISH